MYDIFLVGANMIYSITWHTHILIFYFDTEAHTNMEDRRSRVF